MSGVKDQRGIAPVAIVVVIALFLVGITAGVLATSIASRKPPTKPEKAAAGIREVGVGALPTPASAKVKKIPKSTLTPKRAGSVKEESGVTSTNWAYSGYRDVIVTPSFSTDQKTLIIDFERENFSDIASIFYNLTYNMDDSGGLYGIEGTFNPTNEQPLRKELLLGVCSLGVCTYHTNPRNFKLVVKTTRVGSSTAYEQTLTLSALP